jgi:para-aminobenzoate synthetase/4-amino-4-deoxychorismate lyase
MRGVIETIRVRAGRPIHLEAHVARLDASRETLGIRRIDDLAPRVFAAAAEFDECALRIEVSESGMRISARPLPDRGPVLLEPTVLPGGLGAHKWTDRRLIERLSVDGRLPLFLDLDGTVLEAGHAAVALAVETALLFPPLDGRILPSISRTQLWADAVRAGYEVRTEPFTLRDVWAADGLILTSALRGAHPGVLRNARSRDRTASLWRTLMPEAVKR